MRVATLTNIFTTFAATSSVLAAAVVPQSEINFVTAFVHDLNSNQPEYLGYIATASSVPNDLINLYGEVRTYTDDSYTTLLAGGSINVPEIESFAAALPWATRISSEVAAGQTAAP